MPQRPKVLSTHPQDRNPPKYDYLLIKNDTIGHPHDLGAGDNVAQQAGLRVPLDDHNAAVALQGNADQGPVFVDAKTARNLTARSTSLQV